VRLEIFITVKIHVVVIFVRHPVVMW